MCVTLALVILTALKGHLEIHFTKYHFQNMFSKVYLLLERGAENLTFDLD